MLSDARGAPPPRVRALDVAKTVRTSLWLLPATDNVPLFSLAFPYHFNAFLCRVVCCRTGKSKRLPIFFMPLFSLLSSLDYEA